MSRKSSKLEKARRERERVAANADSIRRKCRTLAGFIKEAWHVVEPETEYVHGWHIDAVCAHLEAVSQGRITRLLINIPPGTMKSLIVSVFWPAWEWGPSGRAGLKYLSTSFSDDNVKRDTRRMRDLVDSEWFQTLWPEVRLRRRGEKSFSNTRGGARDGRAFGSLTGGRGDRLIIDDPHSTETAESDADRETARRIFRESANSRLNSVKRSAIIVIMQRLHENDISGLITELNRTLKPQMRYTHLCLPMEFEYPVRKNGKKIGGRCRTYVGERLFFKDPRSREGELLFAARFPADALERDKIIMGPYAVAGQFQQRPVPREGGMFQREWFEGKIIDDEPKSCVWVRWWDLAGTEDKNAARTAGVKMGRAPDGRIIVAHVNKFQKESPEVLRLMKAQAALDGKGVPIWIPQDPGSAGKTVKKSYMVEFANLGYTLRAMPETGDKVYRADPFSVQCEAGNVYLVRGAWNNDYIDELCLFPGGKWKDQVDASSGAYGRLLLADPLAVPVMGMKVVSA